MEYRDPYLEVEENIMLSDYIWNQCKGVLEGNC